MRLRVRDVMTPDPNAVSPSDTLATAARIIIEKRYSGIPVEDEAGQLVGLVEVEDLLPQPSQVPFTRVPVLKFRGEWVDENDIDLFYKALRDTTVEGTMRRELPTIEPEASIGEALKRLIENEFRRLLVVDDAGKLVGVVTRTDLLRVLAGGS